MLPSMSLPFSLHRCTTNRLSSHRAKSAEEVFRAVCCHYAWHRMQPPLLKQYPKVWNRRESVAILIVRAHTSTLRPNLHRGNLDSRAKTVLLGVAPFQAPSRSFDIRFRPRQSLHVRWSIVHGGICGPYQAMRIKRTASLQIIAEEMDPWMFCGPRRNAPRSTSSSRLRWNALQHLPSISAAPKERMGGQNNADATRFS